MQPVMGSAHGSNFRLFFRAYERESNALDYFFMTGINA